MSDKVEYWLDLCDDDLITAKALLEKKRLLHMGFFCHMIVEKSLKAAVASRTGTTPPKIHDLARLANLGGLWETLSNEKKDLMKTLIPLQIETRYPEHKEKVAATLTIDFCKQILSETEEFLCWIKQQLEK
jgi:HEPN domain-containing protein